MMIASETAITMLGIFGEMMNSQNKTYSEKVTALIEEIFYVRFIYLFNRVSLMIKN